MSLPLHSDGCIVANIPVKHYAVRFAAKCPHTKMRGAIIVIDAPTADDALIYAQKWIRLAQLIPVQVIEIIEPESLAEITMKGNQS
jgi:hypothetical protein